MTEDGADVSRRPIPHRDVRRSGSFGEDAEQYDRARPSYALSLIADLAEGQPRVLDVGCGTGIAARQLLAAGCTVLGVEADERMATVARGRGLEVEVARFEQWERGGRTFDLVTSGQAWHWVDPDVGAVRALEALRSGGRIALLWNDGEAPEPVLEALHEVYARHAPQLNERLFPDGTFWATVTGRAADDLLDAGFHGVEVRTATHAMSYTTDTWVDLLPTHSNHRVLPPETLESLLRDARTAIDAAGGEFVVEYTTWMAEGTAP